MQYAMHFVQLKLLLFQVEDLDDDVEHWRCAVDRGDCAGGQRWSSPMQARISRVTTHANRIPEHNGELRRSRRYDCWRTTVRQHAGLMSTNGVS